MLDFFKQILNQEKGMLFQDFYIVLFQGKFYVGSKQKQHFIILYSTLYKKKNSIKVTIVFNFRSYLTFMKTDYFFEIEKRPI